MTVVDCVNGKGLVHGEHGGFLGQGDYFGAGEARGLGAAGAG